MAIDNTSTNSSWRIRMQQTGRVVAAWLWSLAMIAAAVAMKPDGAVAQDGANDPSFNVADNGTRGPGAQQDGGYPDLYSGTILSIAVQPDGKIVLGGNFQFYNRETASAIVRINANGDRDASLTSVFAPTNSLTTCNVIRLLGDGRILLGGVFYMGGAQPHVGVVRLLGTGELDPTFQLVPFSDNYSGSPLVECMRVQSDGAILVGGRFDTVGGVARKGIVRLTAAGAVDFGFNPNLHSTGEVFVTSIGLQPDGKVLLAWRSQVQGQGYVGNLSRFETNGTEDAGFNLGTGGLWNPIFVEALTDGRLIVAHTSGRIERRLIDGAPDPTFGPAQLQGNAGQMPSLLREVTVLASGKLLIVGGFSGVNGIQRPYLARLNVDGTTDLSFFISISGELYGIPVASAVPMPDGGLLIGGSFDRVGGFLRYGLAKVDYYGRPDPAFNQVSGADGSVRCLARDWQGRLYAAGQFMNFNGQPATRIVRLTADGDVDASYQSLSGPNAQISAMAALPDGRLVIGGDFTAIGSDVRGRLGILDASGGVDPTFNPVAGFDGPVRGIARQPDGKYVVVGQFTAYDGAAAQGIVRFLADWTRDASFSVSWGSQVDLHCVLVRPDGRIMCGGSVTTGSGWASRVFRLTSAGGLDPTWSSPQLLGGGEVRSVALQSDGKLVAGGTFGVARLGIDGWVEYVVRGVLANSLAVQGDGAVVVGGEYSPPYFPSLVRLRPDGVLDPTFDVGAGPDGPVNSLFLQADGKCVVGGWFYSIDGVVRHSLARIVAQQPYQRFCFGDGSGALCPCGNAGYRQHGCGNSVSAAGAVLVGDGVASIASDTFVLHGSRMPDSSVLCFQGTATQSGGLGTPFGDGLRCAGGVILRLGTSTNVAGSSRFPDAGGTPLSLMGAITGPATRHYQLWYRNAASFCTPSSFNLTNGLTVNWTP